MVFAIEDNSFDVVAEVERILSPPRFSIFSSRPLNLVLSGFSFHFPTNELSRANNVEPARQMERKR